MYTYINSPRPQTLVDPGFALKKGEQSTRRKMDIQDQYLDIQL